MNEPRYKLVEGSDSDHCCFEATIIDTTKPRTTCDGSPLISGGVQVYDAMCECFDPEDAEAILTALNTLAELNQPCVWTFSSSQKMREWKTSCGYVLCATLLLPRKFCPYCGHHVTESESEDE